LFLDKPVAFLEGIEMIKPEDLDRLNRHVLLAKLASLSVLFIGMISFTLYFRPALIGVTPEAQGDYQGSKMSQQAFNPLPPNKVHDMDNTPKWIPVLFGSVMLLMGTLILGALFGVVPTDEGGRFRSQRG
jgi:hypothetical protein